MKVLILAYDYPPFSSVGGLRPKSWERDFPKNGVYPIVITRNWNIEFGDERDYTLGSIEKESLKDFDDKRTIIKTPYKPTFSHWMLNKFGSAKLRYLRKGFTLLDEIGQYFIPIGSKKNLYLEAKKYLSENNVDLILVTGEPFVLFRYANWLGGKFNVPYVLDYRDPWSQNATRSSTILKKVYSFIEKQTTKNAAGLTTVSKEFKNTISKLVLNGNFDVFPNGYNNEIFEEVSEVAQSNQVLNITIAGSTYKWHPVKSFLNILKDACTENVNIKVQFNAIGANELMKQEILAFESYKEKPLNLEVNPLKRMDNSELAPMLLKSNILLLFNDYDIIGTKIYDYLGANRKILFCYQNDERALELKKDFFKYSASGHNISKQAELIEKTNSGTIVRDENHLRVELNSLFQEFFQNSEIVSTTIDAEKYSRQYSNARMVEFLKKLVN